MKKIILLVLVLALSHFSMTLAKENTWITKADMPTARSYLSASVVDGKIYAIGGLSSQTVSLPILEVYDPVSDTWTRKADMPTARTGLSAGVVEGKIYAIGGTAGSPWNGLRTVEVYDPTIDIWEKKADMLTGRLALTAGMVDGKIYALGGCANLRPFQPVFSTVEEYDTGLGVPSPDFNGDGIVDCLDMCILVEHWQSDYPSCDIAPPPFGDGIVDVQDLTTLAEHLFEQVIDPTLVAHWPLDETEGMFAANSVGDNDAVVIGGAVWQPDNGQVDGALQLDGVSGCAIANFVLDPADGPFSVLAWVKGGGPEQVVISQQGAANWLATDADGKLVTELAGGSRNSNPLCSQMVITDGTWHRISFVCDGSHRTLCVDGVVVAEDTQSTMGGSQMGLYIGVDKNCAPGTFFSGLIDDIRIYNRAVYP